MLLTTDKQYGGLREIIKPYRFIAIKAMKHDQHTQILRLNTHKHCSKIHAYEMSVIFIHIVENQSLNG